MFIWKIDSAKMRDTDKRFPYSGLHKGSALILAVVLTSLLAIVGVLFVMVSRVDKMATSSISDNKELNFAVDTVVAKISQQLVSDVPGISDQEYYDYPDVNDPWLAVLEPYKSGGNYYWRQISNLTGSLNNLNRDVRAVVIDEYGPITDANSASANADADGDGVGDSKWIKLDDVTSEKGRPIYAAVRIIDNGAMLNANTAFMLDTSDPNAAVYDVGGTSQLQINLMALAGKADEPATSTEISNLLEARASSSLGLDPLDLLSYEQNVIWCYDDPNGPYTPFDISDELELRYRFLLNHTRIDTRLEEWSVELRENTISTPVTSGGGPLDVWFRRAYNEGFNDPNYAYRHIATTYNMDRVINPIGATLNNGKMVNINLADKNLLYAAIKAGFMSVPLGSRVIDPNALAAQLAVNMIDLRDTDAQVTTLATDSRTFYGFEAQPFISEIGFQISSAGADAPGNNDFAIELYNPFDIDIPLSDFRLELRNQSDEVVNTINLTGFAIAGGGRFVVTSSVGASGVFDVSSFMSTGAGREDSNLILAKYHALGTDPETYELDERYDIYLLRRVSEQDIYLDKQETQDDWFEWETVKSVETFYCRPDNDWNIVYQNFESASANSLGLVNPIEGTGKNYNFENSIENFVSVGDLAKALIVGPGADPCDMIGMVVATEPNERDIRMDLRNPAFSKIFNYLTVMDPAVHDFVADETRVKGRININTAPWFVIAQLPWMAQSIAQSITAYRDTVAGGFESIGDLVQVEQMGYYANDPVYIGVDLEGYPDLTPNDGAISDFEERDVIFSRISNLVTVRSDVFTVYILVRIGTDGPQKRVIAILDRSQVKSPEDEVQIIALHPVPDPR